MGQTGNAVRPRPRRLARTAGGHDQTLHPAGKVERHLQRDAPAHGVAAKMRRRNFQMIEQGDDIVGHLIDGVNFLRFSGAAAAARIVQD